MRNQSVGILIIGIAALIGFITYSFNRALTTVINSACSHGPTCPMWGAIDFQTNVSLGIMLLVVGIGLYFIFFGKEKEIAAASDQNLKVTRENYQEVTGNLSDDEKGILEKIIESGGTMFQRDLVQKANFTKAKVTRILDKLEEKGIIERRRSGMSNIVSLKP